MVAYPMGLLSPTTLPSAPAEPMLVFGVGASPCGLRVSTVALIEALCPLLVIDSGMGCDSTLANAQ